MKDTLIQASVALAGVLATMILALGAVFAMEARRRAKQAASDAAVRTLRELAADAVKAIEQTQVSAKKDVNNDAAGSWNSDAAKAAKLNAIITLRVTGRPSLDVIAEGGVSSADLERLVEALVEAAVLDLRMRSQA